MILFMLKKNPLQTGEYKIPDHYTGEKITEENAQFISWNEAVYTKKDGAEIKIQTIKELKEAVSDAAKQDFICKDMNHQYLDQFGISIFDVSGPSFADLPIIHDVFASWPHPMIGNVLYSPGIRPQECEDQYVKNWSSFPEKYMTAATKAVIKAMVDNPGTAGLSPLTKSGRDQVRVCRDMTELARAVMGEISTYATKKLEKIYAFELCGSPKLWAAQKQLIKDIIGAKFRHVKLSAPSGGEKIIEGPVSLRELFLEQVREPITITEYIPFYFPGIAKIQNREMQWAAFVHLLDCSLEEKSGLPHVDPDPTITELITQSELQFKKYPPVIRCAIILNAIKRFEKNYFIRRYSLCAAKESDLGEASEYVVPSVIREASGRDFIPELIVNETGTRKALLWNWMREEEHLATMTYRHYLIPLWAGPSGHTAGLIEFYSRHLARREIEVGTEKVSIPAVLMPTMFAFWRLYYDKRICAVHTLAETFEAGYSFGLHDKDTITPTVKIFIECMINLDAHFIKHPEETAYDDPFDIIGYYPDKVHDSFGVINPVRIMAQIRKKHYVTVKDLDKTLDRLRTELSKKYEIPQWSKPLTESVPSIAQSSTQSSTSSMGHVAVRSFASLRVKTFLPHTSVKNNHRLAALPSDRLLKLYEKISAVKAGYNFSWDFPSLPRCIVDNEIKPFLSAMDFFELQDFVLQDDSFAFTAISETNGDFWRSTMGIVPVKDRETFLCTVSDDDEGFCFTGRVTVNSSYRITDRLSLNMKCIVIKSGLMEGFGFPRFSVAADISNGRDMLELMVEVPLGSGTMNIWGEYDGGRVLTLSRLLSLLGIDEVVPVSSLLPDEEGVFGSLGLRELWLEVALDPVEISRIGLTITAEKPWKLFDDKITLKPYFEINVEYPFADEKRQIDYAVLGKWTMGTTVFDLVYRSDKVIKARLAQDSVLNFKEVAEVFADGIHFPEIKLTGMEMTADPASKDYSLYLEAADVFAIDVGSTKIGIQDIAFSLDFLNGSFGEVALSGRIELGGITLDIMGSYGQNDQFAFKAAAFSDSHVTLGEFAGRMAKDICATLDPRAFPDEFMAAGIRTFCVSYESKDSGFLACVDLDHVLHLWDECSIDELALKISCSSTMPVEFEITALARICENAVSLTLKKEGGDFMMAGSAVFKNLTFQSIAKELGINVGGVPEFITGFAVTSLALEYNMTQKDFKLAAATSAGIITAGIRAGGEKEWRISYQVNPSVSADLLKLPLIGELVERVSPGEHDCSVRDFQVDVSSKDGAAFKCLVFGEAFQLDLYKPENLIAAKGDFGPLVKWIQLNKTIAVLTVAKMGIGLEGSSVMVLVDASLNVKPFSFSVTGAGAGVNISKLSDISFYLSGFGVAFNNGALLVAGSFSVIKGQEKPVYRGALLIKFKDISASAIAEYSSGSLMAYFALCAPIGGPPAFFVTGLALGFGYNKRLVLPEVEAVPGYPLIAAATAGFSPGILEAFGQYIKDEGNQNFLTAGVKFTSFKLINGFLLLSVSFGNEFELGVLGIADVTIPPDVPTNPIAKAQLAIKADFRPSAGVLSVEARLTSESYILSSSCKLTGGFAAFFWFGSHEHSGDFVVSLGGYHPAFRKPEHYPTVPRLGLSWSISSNLKITGELYFALTPSTLMAGGRLSAVYTQGNLKAWFIACADFLISWKPFYYDIRIGVTLGASYRIDWWFIHKTFSIEASADLHLWGPEVQGTIHISWFIISFTISFSTGPDHSGDTLDWRGFKESFLLDTADRAAGQGKGEAGILTLGVEGITGKAGDGIDIADPNTLLITLKSKIPESGNVRPVANALLTSRTAVDVVKRGGTSVKDRFTAGAVTDNVPAAMWKRAPAATERLKEEPVVKQAVCGTSLKSNLTYPGLFPKTRYISLNELYKNNTLTFGGCFHFIPDQRMELSAEDTIDTFSQNAHSEATRKRRQKFLADHGITESISIGNLARDAQDWFTEDILIKARAGERR